MRVYREVGSKGISIHRAAPDSKVGKGESLMPVLFIEAPPGIRPEAKRKMVQKLTEAIDEAYQIGDTLIFLREYSAENVALDGKLQSENPKILA
jgi:phenylpyruvate tautomerase PptA (4-oxalocrotonate tautomerase family)